jgi:phosphoribosylformylglycinamidine synthase
MKARVYVTLKKTVLDPQGQTILRALEGLGYKASTGCARGRCSRFNLNGLSKDEARQQVSASPKTC